MRAAITAPSNFGATSRASALIIGDRCSKAKIQSAVQYTAANMYGWIEDRSLSFHSCPLSEIPRYSFRETHTQVIHAPELGPKAIPHAGSSDWKYSSGWKKVFIQRAFMMRNTMSAASAIGLGYAMTVRTTAATRGSGRSSLSVAPAFLPGRITGVVFSEVAGESEFRFDLRLLALFILLRREDMVRIAAIIAEE